MIKLNKKTLELISQTQSHSQKECPSITSIITWCLQSRIMFPQLHFITFKWKLQKHLNNLLRQFTKAFQIRHQSQQSFKYASMFQLKSILRYLSHNTFDKQSQSWQTNTSMCQTSQSLNIHMSPLITIPHQYQQITHWWFTQRTFYSHQ
jgi:hypothetical protein